MNLKNNNKIAKGVMVFFMAAMITPIVSAQAGGTVFDNIPEGKSRNIEVKYKARLGPIEVARGGLDITLTSNSYNANATYYASGLASSSQKNNGTAAVRGVVQSDRLVPRGYVNQDTGGRRRRVTINFGTNVPSVDAQPEYGSMGNPAATDSQKVGTVDPVTGIMELALLTGRDRSQPCGGSVRIFDGKRRYDISTQYVNQTQTSTPAYRGEVAYCTGTYTQIAGFKKQEDNIRLELWLANINNDGVSVPIRMRLRRGALSATIYADRINMR